MSTQSTEGPGDSGQQAALDLPSPRRFRLGLGAAIVVGLVVLSVAVGVNLWQQRFFADAEPMPGVAVSETPSASVGEAEVYVHVLGAVHAPGLYVLDPSARVVDAVAAAGGSLAEADLAGVNLARPVTDGEQVVVPAQGEAGASAGAAGAGASALPDTADQKIDVNVADAATLDTLPRIGPALAERIIAWRTENGRFVSVDDLLAVSGIGEKLLAGIRDRVRV